MVGSSVQITRSALKHGVDPHDIRHVLTTCIVQFDLDDERTLIIGFGTAQQPFELVVLRGDPLRVIHAMRLRRSLHRHLDNWRPR